MTVKGGLRDSFMRPVYHGDFQPKAGMPPVPVRGAVSPPFVFKETTVPQQKRERPDWGKLFQSILTEPGKLGEYYNLFHRYSLGNQALAMFEMTLRGIPIGPISSFNGWKKLGRKVKKGEKAHRPLDARRKEGHHPEG